MELAQVHEEVSSRTGSTLEESAGLLGGGAGAGAGGAGTIWALPTSYTPRSIPLPTPP